MLWLFFPLATLGQGMNSGLVYVGSSVAQWGSNPDIGAQMNAAYASCPATGCTIILVPQTDGSCYHFSTPIAFTTIGKFVLLQGGGPTSESAGNRSGGVSGGSCLSYVPTTTSVAITMDYGPPFGTANSPAHGIRDLTLINNDCKTLGGCGSSATGIQFGGVNSGAQNGELANVKVSGFGTGIIFLETDTQSWGMVFRGISIASNDVGIKFTGSLENISIFGGRVIGNNTGLLFTGNADVFAHGVSIDTNLTVGIRAMAGSFSCFNCHFENESAGAPYTTHYYLGTNVASLVIEGGKAIDDDGSPGDSTDYWFSNSGLSTYIHGLLIYSPGRTATQVVQSNYPCGWWVGVFNDSPAVLTNVAGGTSTQGVFFPNDLYSGVSSVQTQFLIPNMGTPFSSANVKLDPGFGSTAYPTYPFGNTQRFSFGIISSGSGQVLNPVMHITFPTLWPQTPFYICKMVGGTGVIAPIDGEANATRTGMELIYNGKPVAGSTYQIQCVGE
jgi:hypothetical protein